MATRAQIAHRIEVLVGNAGPIRLGVNGDQKLHRKRRPPAAKCRHTTTPQTFRSASSPHCRRASFCRRGANAFVISQVFY